MIDFFVQKIQTEQKKQIHAIEAETMQELLRYDYPGNVRELKNILERFIAVSYTHLEKELMTIVRSSMPSTPKSGRNGCS